MKRIHFVGIKGVAMASLAIWYKEAGFLVTGSDIAEEFPTDHMLAKAKISVFSDFHPRNLGGRLKPSIVIYTGAHNGKSNEEVVAASALGIRVVSHAEALGNVMAKKKQISIAGSHGKTTTSAMVASIFASANQDPSWAIGCGEIKGVGLSGHYGSGKFFVAEADEYVTDPQHDVTPRFLWQKPEFLIVTNIDFDHPDVYSSLLQVQDAFVKLKKKSIHTIVNVDDAPSDVLLEGATTYGFSPRAQFRVNRVAFGNGRTFFSLEHSGMQVGEFSLRVPGKFNALNAAAAATCAHLAGVNWREIAKGLNTFAGTKRRFEQIGTRDGVLLIDDYAHHPKEIVATLQAARDWYPKQRVIAVFQPHTYSRTRALMTEFSKAFLGAHMVILTDIYPSAREKDVQDNSAISLFQMTSKFHQNVHFGKDEQSVQTLLRSQTKRGDVVIFMGAGSIYVWAHSMM